jgi:hypothetical protein
MVLRIELVYTGLYEDLAFKTGLHEDLACKSGLGRSAILSRLGSAQSSGDQSY